MSNGKYATPPTLPGDGQVYIWWAGPGFLAITTPS